jgi:predicted MPP superfamily phosphohydrolase
MRFSRRSFILSTLGVTAAVPGYARLVEPGWLDLTKKQVPLPNLQAPIRILHLTDLHAGADAPFELVDQAISLGLSEKPDLACLTGDYISWGERPDMDRFREMLGPLSSRVPVYASFGNHDGGLWAAQKRGLRSVGLLKGLMESVGVHCLHNSSTTIEAGESRLNLVGMGDLWAREFDPATAFAGVGEPGMPVIALSHNPDTVEELAAYPWDLTLSGHTHGGQVVVPLVGLAPFVPVQDRRFIEGLCPFEDRLVHVSRGVGSILGVRLSCRPEVSILDLIPA